MKRYSCLVFVIVLALGFSTVVQARTEGLINSESENLRLSLDFSYGQADFEEVDGSRDSEVINYFAGVRLEKALTDELQVYVSGGQVNNEFSDSDVEDGVRYGGGVQYVFNQEENLYYKLFGSYMKHSDEDFKNNTSRSLEVVNDWQAGLMISRNMTDGKNYESWNQSHAYMTLLYSGKEVELTESGTVSDFEFSEGEGLSLTGGVRIEVEEGLQLEVEAEAGSTFGATGRLSATF